MKQQNKVLKYEFISRGGIAGTVVDVRLLVKLAVDNLASGIVLVHNHPSGNLTPSQSDTDLTRKLKEGGKVLEIQMLDHILFYS